MGLLCDHSISLDFTAWLMATPGPWAGVRVSGSSRGSFRAAPWSVCVCYPHCFLKMTLCRVWGQTDSRPQVRGSSVNPSLFDKDHRAAVITQLLSKMGTRRDGPRIHSRTTTASDRERIPEESGGRHLSLRGEASLAHSGDACLCSDAAL